MSCTWCSFLFTHTDSIWGIKKKMFHRINRKTCNESKIWPKIHFLCTRSYVLDFMIHCINLIDTISSKFDGSRTMWINWLLQKLHTCSIGTKLIAYHCYTLSSGCQFSMHTLNVTFKQQLINPNILTRRQAIHTIILVQIKWITFDSAIHVQIHKCRYNLMLKAMFIDMTADAQFNAMGLITWSNSATHSRWEYLKEKTTTDLPKKKEKKTVISLVEI